MSFICDHLYTIDPSLSQELLLNRQNMGCSWCGSDKPDLWLCLFSGCLKVGCGVQHYNHSYLHNMDRQSHCITINLSNYKLWCYACKIEFNTRSIGKMDADPSQQQHLGSPINACDVIKAQPANNTDSSSEDEDDSVLFGNLKPKGLVGLRNLGLTCYMNAALQALSNSLPLASYMSNISPNTKDDRRSPAIVNPFNKLLVEIWNRKRPRYVVPTSLYQHFKSLYPMFRPYTQQDSQEFLRYFMDQLHEELKQPYIPMVSNDDDHNIKDLSEEADMSSLESDSICGSISTVEDQSEGEAYETCESGMSDAALPASCLNRRKRKRSKSSGFSSSSWIPVSPVIANTGELDHSETETTSNASLVVRKNLRSKRISASSSSTSGIGSSKPSVYSASSAAGKTSAWVRQNKSNASVKPNVYPSNPGAHRKKKPVQYKSIVSDIFDGVLVSSVQCLTCNRVSSRKETFQDLSLPIPSAEQLGLLEHTTQQSHSVCTNAANMHAPRVACDINNGWMWMWFMWMFLWFRSWVWGPAVSLMHCLAAFSSDELKGENMYSCEKCSKLRNGVKFSRFLELPETLIIHLKRFRHEYMFSSKINQYVSFPLHDLDLTPFLHKNCKSSVHTYDLYAVICHHGAVGSGHYTTYAKNELWYEFDDECVKEVTPEVVENCEAYVLFYKKSSTAMIDRRQRTVELLQVSSNEPSLMNFYISKEWLNKFNTFSEPGPIDNLDFLCPHGGVQPMKSQFVTDMVMELSQGVWEYLHQAFGGGPACTKLYECVTCREEMDSLHDRQLHELQSFVELHKRFKHENPSVVYAIAMQWYCEWEKFARGRSQEPPGPVDNSTICVYKYGNPMLKQSSDYGPISSSIWSFFCAIYGGGPELVINYGSPKNSRMYSNYEEDQRRECVDESSCSSHRSLSTDNLPLNGLQERVVMTTRLRQRTVSDGEVYASAAIAPTSPRKTVVRYVSHDALNRE